MKRHWWAILLATAAVLSLLGVGFFFPYSLRKEQALAHSAGIPLTYAEIPWTPVLRAEDAAPWYTEFRRQLDAVPFTPRENAAREKLGQRGALTVAERAILRHALSTRQPMLDALHRAAGMPKYSHPRPAARVSTSPMHWEGYESARLAANMLRDEARILAQDGRYEEAARVQALGYNVAGHVYQYHALLPYLIGNAMTEMTYTGLTSVLAAAGPDAEVAQAVLQATLSAPNPDLVDWLRGDVPGTLQSIRSHDSWMNLKGQSYRGTPFPLDTLTVRAMAPAISAAWLHWMRRMIVAADQPPEKRQRAMQSVAHEVASNRLPGPALWLPKLQMEFTVRKRVQEDHRRARRQVLIAAAAVMEHRGRTGQWPKSLASVAPQPPTDPFTGKPLGYRREGSGFVVFSAGESGTFAAKPGQSEKGEALFRYPRP